MSLRRKKPNTESKKFVETDTCSDLDESSNKRQKLLNYDICPICLVQLSSFSTLASPDTCDHIFCLSCLDEWSTKMNTCPTDRKAYAFIVVKDADTLETIIKLPVDDKCKHDNNEDVELTYCEVCHLATREDRMLLCDACDKGYHCDCLNPTLEQIPEGDWFCEPCLTSRASLTNIQLGEVMPSTSAAADRTIRRRVIARTNLSERVRRRVVANRAELAVRTEVDKSSNTKTVKKATKKTPIKNERTKIQKPSTRAKRISNNAEQRVSDLDRFIADFQNEWQRENSVQEKLGIYVVLFIFLVMFLMFK